MKLLASLAFLAGTAGAFNQPQSFGGTGAAAAAAGAGSGQRSLHPSPLMPESSPLLTMNSDNPFASKVNDLRMVAGGAQAEEYYEGALEIAPLVLRTAALVRLRWGHLVPPWAHLVFLAVYSVGSVCIYFYRVIRRIEGKPTTSDDIESIVDCDDGVFCKGRPERNGR